VDLVGSPFTLPKGGMLSLSPSPNASRQRLAPSRPKVHSPKPPAEADGVPLNLRRGGLSFILKGLFSCSRAKSLLACALSFVNIHEAKHSPVATTRDC